MARNGAETAERRRELLERGSATAGAQWAAGRRDELRREGRPAAGGWPGTLSEARARASVFCAAALAAGGHSAPTYQEREAMARAANAAARREWLAHREPEREPATV